jgi:uncharacterized BrkB/YihY/UPF0761 family membrane protein
MMRKMMCKWLVSHLRPSGAGELAVAAAAGMAFHLLLLLSPLIVQYLGLSSGRRAPGAVATIAQSKQQQQHQHQQLLLQKLLALAGVVEAAGVAGVEAGEGAGVGGPPLLLLLLLLMAMLRKQLSRMRSQSEAGRRRQQQQSLRSRKLLLLVMMMMMMMMVMCGVLLVLRERLRLQRRSQM